jgi:hypothetical protein
MIREKAIKLKDTEFWSLDVLLSTSEPIVIRPRKDHETKNVGKKSIENLAISSLDNWL